MSTPRRAAARPRLPTAPGLAILAVLLLAGCGQSDVSPTPSSSVAIGTPTPVPSPTPTPAQTPTFTNPADPALAALIPTIVNGQTVVVPAVTEFGLTPGDIGAVYGEIGDRFSALQVAFIERPRLSLYAMRMDPPVATTADLEPYLAAAGEYVGIAGLHREPWELATIGAKVVWLRPGDNATLPGTQVFTWATGGYVFLMTGVDEAQNLAMLAALPGEAPPTPSPLPSASGLPTSSGAPSTAGS